MGPATILLAMATSKVLNPPAGLDDEVAVILSNAAKQFNTSFSVGIVGPTGSPWEIAHAAGVQDRSTGVKLGAHSMIPVGSVTKAWTSVRTMQLVEQGKIGLDTPAHTYIDPWLAKQNPPAGPLLAMWNSDTTIETVTVKHLLAMTSGLRDYDDTAFETWTIENPDKDATPLGLIGALNKTFLFKPGSPEEAAYSSDGFVLLGMVLASVTDAPTYDKLDQMVVNGSEASALFGDTIFMGPGRCSTHPDVPHQYIVRPPALRNHRRPNQLRSHPSPDKRPDRGTYINGGLSLSSLQHEAAVAMTAVGSVDHATLSLAPAATIRSHEGNELCADRSIWTSGFAWEGKAVGFSGGTPTAEDCCAFANANPYNMYPQLGWTWYPPSICVIFAYTGTPATPSNGTVKTAVSGPILSPKPTEDWFIDLYETSCLNGWTMGNAATASIDMARFFSAFAAGDLLSDAAVDLMKPDHVFSQGFAACTGSNSAQCLVYGLGFMRIPRALPIPYPAQCNGHPNCGCLPGTQQCGVTLYGYGHPGQDWGSGMSAAEFYPDLGNVSVALAVNSVSGLNTSLTVAENGAFNDYTLCQIMRALANTVNPTFPKIICMAPF